MNQSGEFVVVWEHITDDALVLFARRFAANGTPLGDEFHVASMDQLQAEPSVTLDADGNFVITWSSNYSHQPADIYARRFDNQGLALGDEFQVSSDTNSSHGYPKVALDENDDFVITWYSTSGYSSSESIRGQRYDSQGQPLGTEITIAASEASPHHDLAMMANGHFVEVWNGTYNGVDGLFARRYDNQALPLGVFQVTDTSNNWPASPSLSIGANGSMIVAWEAGYPNLNIFARRFNSSGVPQGNMFRVNTHPNSVWNAATAINTNGDFIIAWSSWLQDGEYSGVYAQHNMPVAPNIPILLSTASNGTIKGLAYQKSDILRFTPATETWSMFFDGSDVGIKQNLLDFALLDDGSLLLILAKAQTVAGLGAVPPQDIIRFVPTSLGNNTAGVFERYFDGSDVELVKKTEALDALALDEAGNLILSTTGNMAAGGLTATDEDLLLFTPTHLGPGAPTTGSWSHYLLGQQYGLTKDVTGVWADTVSDDLYLYLTFNLPVTLEDAALNNTLIRKGAIGRCRPQMPYDAGGFNGCLIDEYWDANDYGLHARIDAIELELP